MFLCQAAAYYDVTGEELDLIPTVSYAAGVPTCLVATYLIESRGLRAGVRIGAYLTGIGGLMCCLSTLPGLNHLIPKYYQYWMAVIGQGITGVACPFISGVPTKVSQHWFPDSQRTMATSILGMSYPLGIVLGQGVTPALVQHPHSIPYMNIAFFVPALVGTVLGLLLVKTNLPPTPPSASEEQQRQTENNNLKKLVASQRSLRNKLTLALHFQNGLHWDAKVCLHKQSICDHVLVPGRLHVIHFLPGDKNGTNNVQVIKFDEVYAL